MGLKEMLKKDFTKQKTITLERYKASKFMLVISSFVFFLNFYFVGARFYLNIFTSTLGITYIILLLSFVYYVYFFIKNMYIEKIKNYYFILIFIVLFIMFLIFAFPLIFSGSLK
ncbi:MAG: hypothetical protein QM490_04800 [Candidatus Gracilibacteria bacterium]